MTFQRPCLFCDKPAESLSMYCFAHAEEQKNAKTGDARIDRFVDEQYREYVTPSRRWEPRSRQEFSLVEVFDDQDGRRIGIDRGTPRRVKQHTDPGDPLYEAEVGWFDVRMPNDRFVGDTAVTLEQMSENDAI